VTGETLVESDVAGSFQNEYVFFNGQRVARRELATNNVHYYFSDHLGTHSIVTDANGNIEDESDYYPYGGEQVITNSVPQNYKFTGKERDTESGLDNFEARYDASALGRFMTPDPGGAGARLTDPQTWNAYAYVENNPLNLTDPTGLVATAIASPFGLGPESCGPDTGDCYLHDWDPGEGPPAQNACQSQSCNVKVISDTGPTGTPNPFPSPNGAEIIRDITYQAVDSKGNAVPNAEISLHETPLPGKEGGDAENYNYAKGKGTSNSSPGDEANHRAGQFQDRLSQGSNGPAGFRQTYTVEGKPAKIIWRKDVPAAPSQKVLIRTDKVVINPEVNQ
jgi:RHS repeat-associated protein